MTDQHFIKYWYTHIHDIQSTSLNDAPLLYTWTFDLHDALRNVDHTYTHTGTTTRFSLAAGEYMTNQEFINRNT